MQLNDLAVDKAERSDDQGGAVRVALGEDVAAFLARGFAALASIEPLFDG